MVKLFYINKIYNHSSNVQVMFKKEKEKKLGIALFVDFIVAILIIVQRRRRICCSSDHGGGENDEPLDHNWTK